MINSKGQLSRLHLLRCVVSSLVCCAALLVTTGALAGDNENWCRGVPDEDPPFAAAQVTGAPDEKILFQDVYDDNHREGDGKCPNLDLNLCPMKRYLIPGDNVIVSRKRFKDFSCVWYRKKNYTASGWVLTAKIKVTQTPESPSLQAWIGKWTDGQNTISIQKLKDGLLELNGDAVWYGGPYGEIQHFGEFSASEKPEGREIKIVGAEKEACRVKLFLLGDQLVVGDNRKCGGVNITFSDVYWRSEK